MNFNLEARTELAAFIKDISNESGFSKREIEKSVHKSRALFKKYSTSPERSYLAQQEYLAKLLTPLNKVNSIIYNKKNWWEKFVGFFGFISPEEEELQSIIGIIEKSRANATTTYNNIHYPNFIFRILHFFGFDLRQVWQRDHYDQYQEKEKLTYLSHHLMGNTDLNHHEILQGKVRSSAYQHFLNDLSDFVNIQTLKLDNQTKKLFNDLQKQIEECSKFSYELDTIHVIKQLNEDKEAQQELVYDLSYQVQKSLFELPPGDSLIIPHGYVTANGGHATVIECQKINNQEVIFKIINTGAGETQTESYRTLFLSLISATLTRPVKVTSNMSIEEIFGTNFIEELLTPLIIEDGQSMEKMTALFLRLYHEGRLHDDKHLLTLQVNGVCAHSSLLAWFKTKVPEPTFLLFQFITAQKALQRLDQFIANYNESEFTEDISQVLLELREAGKRTVEDASSQLAHEKKRIIEEKMQLQSQLSSLLDKKGKQIEAIPDLPQYFEKKLQKEQLTPIERKDIAETDSLTKWVTPTQRRGFWPFFTTETQPCERPLSDQAQKAIIAKKIIGHDAFINATESAFRI
ncbi:hypothetical protein Lsan_3999 [Legionella santicrucis]|uniref:Uncharacterized protein n=1 Tax=Legionella santicrucis TaxID=45074 RepID=A0A0W0Y9L9_9GAMM|nr:hypothetical protein [Legionella santicrucis]KTD53589.1 hypothetical protein Lsan_3999 [Legionella santicrucis]